MRRIGGWGRTAWERTFPTQSRRTRASCEFATPFVSRDEEKIGICLRLNARCLFPGGQVPRKCQQPYISVGPAYRICFVMLCVELEGWVAVIWSGHSELRMHVRLRSEANVHLKSMKLSVQFVPRILKNGSISVVYSNVILPARSIWIVGEVWRLTPQFFDEPSRTRWSSDPQRGQFQSPTLFEGIVHGNKPMLIETFLISLDWCMYRRYNEFSQFTVLVCVTEKGGRIKDR